MDATELARVRAAIRRYGWDVPERALAAVAAALAAPAGREVLPYPWDGLEDRLGGGRLALLGYGSLMNPTSAARTLSHYPTLDPTPVLVFGGRRVYHYLMPDAVVDRYPPVADPRERAALNVVPTGRPGDYFNAVRLNIPESDLPALREREQAYDLAPLPYLVWAGGATEPAVGYALASPPGPAGRTDDRLLPHPGYHDLCHGGAGAHVPGAGFTDCFRDTCFLADGRPAREWRPAERL